MPTGYTAEIENDQTFEDFVLGCARAFGACVMQRDEPMSVKPKVRERDTYYENCVKEYTEKLEELFAMTSDEQIAHGAKLRKEEFKYHNEAIANKREMLVKCRTMRQKVLDWQIPTSDHSNLKQFMIDQINDTINYDCDFQYHLKQLEVVEKMSDTERFNQDLRLIQSMLSSAVDRLKEQEQKDDGSSDWVIKLYESLGLNYPQG